MVLKKQTKFLVLFLGLELPLEEKNQLQNNGGNNKPKLEDLEKSEKNLQKTEKNEDKYKEMEKKNVQESASKFSLD